MISKSILTGLIGTIVSFGIAGSAGADPDGSQRLRGMEGRVFFVQVHDLFNDVTDPNCYFFNSEGIWDDPKFPVLGNWSQNSIGAKTSYTADAFAAGFNLGTEEEPFIVDLLLEQSGNVTPAGGKGTLQLTAFSQAFFVDFMGGGDLVIGEFVSVGYEVDECPL
jgi:hypothetical protein